MDQHDTYMIIEQEKYGVELSLDIVPKCAINRVIELIDNYFPLYATEEKDCLVKDKYVNICVPYNQDVLIMITDIETKEVLEVDLIEESEIDRVIRQARIEFALS